MANVFANFKATKNLGTKLILLDDSSVELLAMAIVVSAKMRFRCLRATRKMWRLSKSINIFGKGIQKLRLCNGCYLLNLVCRKNFESSWREHTEK